MIQQLVLPRFVQATNLALTIDQIKSMRSWRLSDEPFNPSLEDAELEFTDGALAAIAEKAQQRETGARGLRSIIEHIMLDIMFELPDQSEGEKHVVTEAMVNGHDKMFPVDNQKQKSA